MKLAYLIQSHKNVDQVERLVHALTALDPGSRIYLSHDHRDGPGVERLACDRVRVTRDAGGRGGFHPVARWLRLVNLVAEDGGADYVVQISGQDYPVRPLAQMHTELQDSGDGFLEFFPALTRVGNHWPVREGRGRYLYRWRELVPIPDAARLPLAPLHALNFLQPWVRFNVAYGGLKVGRWRGSLPEGLCVFGGSMFPSLSWRSVTHVAHVARTRPDIMAWARDSLVIDEAFFQSLLLSEPGFTFEPSARRHFQFEGSRFGHPAVLTRHDLPQILAGDAYFARKFDTTVDATVLDLIDESLNIRVPRGQHA